MPVMMRIIVFVLFSVAAIGPSQISLAADRCAGAPRPSELVLPAVGSPFIFRVPDGIVHPVAGTDGSIHLAYLAQVTNATEAPGKDFRVVPVDPLTNFQPTGQNFVETDEGQVITSLIQPFSKTPQEGVIDPPVPPPATIFIDKLMPGGSGIVYFDVAYDDEQAVPALISHQLFVDLNLGGVTKHTAFTTPLPVDRDEPAVLSPPLRGPGWVNTNGCCAVVGDHRNAAFPFDGELRPAQQFAIDWAQMGADRRCCTGDPSQLSSWIGYGAPIFAAASGTVFSVARSLPDQQPVGTIRGIDDTNAAGNSVIEDIGRGRFILYAHRQPGSIPASLRPGTDIQPGQQIGRLGNSGSSSAPHLHFQVMDRPSALVAAGLPFVFNRLQVQGRVVGAEGPAVADFVAGRPLPITTAAAARNGSGCRSQARSSPSSDMRRSLGAHDDFLDDAVGVGGPKEGFGFTVVLAKVAVDRGLQVDERSGMPLAAASPGRSSASPRPAARPGSVRPPGRGPRPKPRIAMGQWQHQLQIPLGN